MDLSGFEPEGSSRPRSTNIDEYKLFEHLEIIKYASQVEMNFFIGWRMTGSFGTIAFGGIAIGNIDWS